MSVLSLRIRFLLLSHCFFFVLFDSFEERTNTRKGPLTFGAVTRLVLSFVSRPEIDPQSLQMQLRPSANNPGQSLTEGAWQKATFNASAGTWSIDYVLPVRLQTWCSPKTCRDLRL